MPDLDLDFPAKGLLPPEGEGFLEGDLENKGPENGAYLGRREIDLLERGYSGVIERSILEGSVQGILEGMGQALGEM